MTGLLNRRGFMVRLEQHFAQPCARSEPATLFDFAPDNFKLVIDRHGHEAGDRALIEAAEALADFTCDPEPILGLSIGAAVLEHDTTENPLSLVEHAYSAMYAVKHGGKGGLKLAPPQTSAASG